MNINRSIMKKLVRNAAKKRLNERACRIGSRALGFLVCDLEGATSGCTRKLPPLFEATHSRVTPPKAIGQSMHVHSQKIPGTVPLIFENIIIWPDSTLFVQGNSAFAPDHAIKHVNNVSWISGESCCYDYSGKVSFKRLPKIQIDKGICAFGHAAVNWYHWLIEILPMVMLSQQLGPEYDDVPLLVPSHILENPNFRDSFAIFRGDRPIISLDPDHCYEVGEMMAIPSPVYGPFNIAKSGWPQPDQYLQNVTILKHFREQILKAFLPRNETSASPQRVFLSRPSGKRSYNQDELEVIARREGFAIVSPETLSFGEQVRLFNNADMIVGATGAAWACSLFMKLGSKALIWAPIEVSGGCFFSNLALVSGSDVSYQFIKSAVPLKSTHEAHRQSYTVPLDEFSHNLSILCDNSITLHGSV